MRLWSVILSAALQYSTTIASSWGLGWLSIFSRPQSNVQIWTAGSGRGRPAIASFPVSVSGSSIVSSVDFSDPSTMLTYMRRSRQPSVLRGLARRWPARLRWSWQQLVDPQGRYARISRKLASGLDAYFPQLGAQPQFQKNETLFIDGLDQLEAFAEDCPFAQVTDQSGGSQAPLGGNLLPRLNEAWIEALHIAKAEGLIHGDHARASTHVYFIAGPAGAGGTLHTDPDATGYWNAVIHGRKRWMFIHPDDLRALASSVVEQGSSLVKAVVQLSTEDGYDDGLGVSQLRDGSLSVGVVHNALHRIPAMHWFSSLLPLLADANVSFPHQEAFVEAGDVLYGPPGLVHVVLTLEDSVGCSEQLVDQINLADWIRDAAGAVPKDGGEHQPTASSDIARLQWPVDAYLSCKAVQRHWPELLEPVKDLCNEAESRLAEQRERRRKHTVTDEWEETGAAEALQRAARRCEATQNQNGPAADVPKSFVRVLHQQFRTADQDEWPPEWRALSSLWRKHNPHWGYRFWTDADEAQLFKEYLPEFAEMYQQLPHCKRTSIAQADLATYAILYLHGGVYADLDTSPVKSLDDILEVVVQTMSTAPAVIVNIERTDGEGGLSDPFATDTDVMAATSPCHGFFYSVLLSIQRFWQQHRDILCAHEKVATYDLMYMTAYGRLSMCTRAWTNSGLDFSALSLLETMYLRDRVDASIVDLALHVLANTSMKELQAFPPPTKDYYMESWLDTLLRKQERRHRIGRWQRPLALPKDAYGELQALVPTSDLIVLPIAVSPSTLSKIELRRAFIQCSNGSHAMDDRQLEDGHLRCFQHVIVHAISEEFTARDPRHSILTVFNQDGGIWEGSWNDDQKNKYSELRKQANVESKHGGSAAAEL